MPNETTSASASLVSKLRVSISILALVAITVASLSAFAFVRIGRDREELIDVNLQVLLKLDSMKTQIPALLQAVLPAESISDRPLWSDAARSIDLLRIIETDADELAALDGRAELSALREQIALMTVESAQLQQADEALATLDSKHAAFVRTFVFDLVIAQGDANAAREVANAALKSSERIEEARLKEYLLLESIVATFEKIGLDFDGLVASQSLAEVEQSTGMLRLHMRDLTFQFARLPETEMRGQLVEVAGALRQALQDEEIIKTLKDGIELRSHANQSRTRLVDLVIAFEASLSDLVAEQASLVRDRARSLSALTRTLYLILVSLSAGVIALTLWISYRLVERGVASRLRRLSANLRKLNVGTTEELVLPGPKDELNELNTALNDLRLSNIERDSLVEELRRATDEALNNANAKGRFLSTMSHEVKTPLNAIIGMFELLEAADIPERQKLRAQSGRRAGETLLGLLNNVLEVSRSERGPMSYEPVQVDMDEFRGDLLGALEGSAASKGSSVTWHLDWDEHMPDRLTFDAFRLKQIVQNLIDNAFKFTAAGRVAVSVRFTIDPVPELVVEVEDTGIGIADELRDVVFEPFRQVDDTIRRRFGGSGLGLSICRSLAETMGGTLEVTSELGKGSTFTLHLQVELDILKIAV